MLEELRAFTAVVERTSLTKAANALALTQSAVSRRVQQLEEQLGATLLDRSSRPPTATAVGRRVYLQATALLRDLDRLMNIPKDDGEPSGTLRLGLPQVVADVALFDIAMGLKASFPALDLRCRTEWSSGLQREVASGEVDAAAIMAPSGGTPPAGASASLIATLDVLIVQSRRAPIATKPVAVADLAEQQWILNPLGCGYRAALQRAMEGAGKQVRLGVDMHGTETQLRLVAAGLGLGLAPTRLLASSLHLSELCPVEVTDFELKLDLWLLRAPEIGNLGRAVDALGQILAGRFEIGRRSSGGQRV
ncbi:LysR family transcriptional regulator [Piscinibacter sp.]|uniref:LysR family transcriptional regulator n=1 Tax=Piscinibacter sp. TaxID=1903157 RepID=UPI001DEB6086|nr:LysR family transcriptional regulator [Piscinibacter sp.]MBK7529746.1 LysR family transcriptional regulator [Piscinibacter sp.]